MVGEGKNGSQVYISLLGMEMGQLAKNWGGKRNGWIAPHLPDQKLIAKRLKTADMVSIA
jgi:hypothetical protein